LHAVRFPNRTAFPQTIAEVAMSFEVYLQCFENGVPAGVSRSALADLFHIGRIRRHEDEWEVDYGDTGCDLILQPLDEDDDLIHNVTVERPCQDMRLWEAIHAVMKLGPVVLYFPGDVAPLVANEAAIGHLPPDMVEDLGEPVIAGSAEEIVTYIATA
jgi:hypothetical protein